MKIAVLGAGSWGTAIAALLTEKVEKTYLWARRAEIAESINKNHFNPDYLKDAILPKSLEASSSIREVIKDADIVILAVPSSYLRSLLENAKSFILKKVKIVSLIKGIEESTLMRMSEVILDVLGKDFEDKLAVLSGPNHSEEVIKKIPTASVIASKNIDCATELQEIFMTDYFRVYTNMDLIGVELGGAIKNVLAIAVGISDGLGYGDNTRATLITRGLAEMKRLGCKLGANPSTLLGLAGLGDLIATATSKHSRNRMVGERIGKGEPLKAIIGSMKMVAEGVKTSRCLFEIAQREKIEMPITEEVVNILYHGKNPKESVLSLMKRKPKPETSEGLV